MVDEKDQNLRILVEVNRGSEGLRRYDFPCKPMNHIASTCDGHSHDGWESCVQLNRRTLVAVVDLFAFIGKISQLMLYFFYTHGRLIALHGIHFAFRRERGVNVDHWIVRRAFCQQHQSQLYRQFFPCIMPIFLPPFYALS